MRIQEIAEIVYTNAMDKGFDPSTWDNLPVKLALVITELDEAQEAAEHPQHNLPEELADVAIRLLSTLHSVFPQWNLRTQQKRPKLYQAIEVSLWEILSPVCKAIEYWRHDNLTDTQISLELALHATFAVSADLDINLYAEILKKHDKNCRRPHLHGKARSAG